MQKEIQILYFKFNPKETDRNRQEQTGTDRNRQEQTRTDRNRQEHIGTDRNRQDMEKRERAVCGTLCLCLAVAVMSAVALVYLTGTVQI